VAEVAQELSAGRAMLGRAANRGIPGGADNQDPDGRGVIASKRQQGTTGLVTA
jgi:NAD(P)H dehydrogenase (quinone)